ncbi:hypothetical protein LEP1GSC043_1475 [Leptospira weilii str. Ecochallenge]|uniref:Uncharacterized protein n=1 Tax=Leptospira weilii str. Ecochallenge TaxID=1049986 RepID=N1TZA0_9LEPT|nr:hypothetical protein LEP1GSC043_1475 [Leptospira weilii str. Ecochallenge]
MAFSDYFVKANRSFPCVDYRNQVQILSVSFFGFFVSGFWSESSLKVTKSETVFSHLRFVRRITYNTTF